MSGAPAGWTPVPAGRDHLAALAAPLQALGAEVDRLDAWGRQLAAVLSAGGRLLAAGNGGSAAQAQHLTSELVGRYRDDRPAFSALALHAESSSLTAIANDYGYDESFARQVRGHGRPGDVLIALSTSGRSPNVLAAAEAAQERGLVTWALTGPAPNPLQAASDDALCVAASTATTQEIHQIAVHVLCAAFERALETTPAAGAGAGPQPTAPRTVRPVSGRPARPARPVVVVGDALLDCDLDGSVDRLCPDAPVPVVDRPTRQARPGGAGLAATLAAGGRPVVLVTALGDDDPGRELAGLLAGAGVEVIDLTTSGDTPQKVRVRSGGQSLLRLDHGGPPGRVGPLTDRARQALEGAAAVLVSDYGRALTAHREVRRALAQVMAPVVWDPHLRGSAPVPGARLVTPNRAEAREFAPGVDGTGLSADTARGRLLADQWQAAGVAVTLGAAGAVLVAGDGLPFVVPAPPAAAGDPCGAGDCFAATAAGCLADGALPSEAVVAAVTAASAFVAGLRSPEHDPTGRRAPAQAESLASAEALVRAVRVRGGTVVTTGGCFDLLHAGHVRLMEAARRLGDCLVLCLNSDASVRRLKGPGRPVVGQEDRAGVLLALAAVDAVVIFDEDTPATVLDRLRPDIFAKGGDYSADALPETAVLAGWGGQTVILPYIEGRSTTRILEEAARRGP